MDHYNCWEGFLLKRLLSMLFILTILIGMLPVTAAGNPSISGTVDTATPGEQVTVTLDFSNNPGIASWTLMLEWDKDALQLDEESITLDDGFAGGIFAANGDNTGELRLAWASMENVEIDGTLLTLTFTVSESAEADTYPITITASGVSNQEGETVSVTTSDAAVTLPEEERPNSRPSKPNEPADHKPVTESPEEEEPVKISFADMPETAYYYQPALWAAERGITSGTAPDMFSPEVPCDRAQAVTFLWRAYGSPEPTLTTNPFADISPDAYYYKAVLWAIEQGITTGTTETTFSPNAIVTRAQITAFLYRSVQATGGGFQGAWMFRIPFTDLPEWAFESIAWCYMKNITTGTSETTFSPDQPCTRGQIVTFLYRAFAESEN